MELLHVQAYIEEVPRWSSGEGLAGPPLSSMQWLVWVLASAGKFFEGFIVFIGGIALPLVHEEFALNAAERGMLTAAPLFGILVGALVLGGLADRWGRKPVFIAEMVLLLLGLIGAAFSPSFALLLGCLLLVGVALGADYPTAHLVISESIPSAIRGRLVLGAFSFQALGALAATALGIGVLLVSPELQAWRSFYFLSLIHI